MQFNNFRNSIEQILAPADIEINGSRSWDIQVHNDRFFSRVLVDGSMGLGESYMEGWWDCQCLDEFFSRVLRAGLDTKVLPWTDLFGILRARLFNLQRPSRAFDIGKHHYDIGNDLFECMLDRNLIYSCGYWENAENLDEAQENKLKLVCQKLDLSPNNLVLDVGCGWGGAARFIAQEYGARVVGITVSEEQVKLAKQMCKGLPIMFHLQDYRDLTGSYDRVYSLGMFEHVGYKNYRAFLKIIRDHLKDDGVFLLHTIGGNHSVTKTDPWIGRYIFPNSVIPSAKQLTTAIEGLFVIEDWQNFGADYDNTLMHWYQNFKKNWQVLKRNYDERFYRMWKYYLLSCAGLFRARKSQVWQLVLSPNGIPGGYKYRRTLKKELYHTEGTLAA